MIYSPNHNYKLPYKNSNDEDLWLTHPFMGWLASGLCDRNGKEIFEGDRVCYDDRTDEIHTVTFGDGGFWLDSIPLSEFVGDTLEIVGHVTDTAEDINHVES